MTSKRRNDSQRLLFLVGGRLDLSAWGEAEMDRQTRQASYEQDVIRRHDESGEPVYECPCGCGLQHDICQKTLDRNRALDDLLPF